jgi:hypothetical protein
MGQPDTEVVLAGLRVLGWGLVGILATTGIFILFTYLLRRAFPPGSENPGGAR